MTKQQLDFLDFILPKLSKYYPKGQTLSVLANFYKNETEIFHSPQELELFKNLYKLKYFVVQGNLNYIVITPETKNLIDHYGLLSSYLSEREVLESKEKSIDNELKALRFENLKLQNDNLKHQSTIQEQENRIRNLDEQNKLFQVLKGYWWLIGISIGLGILLSKIIALLCQSQ